MVIDELIVRNGTANLPIDSYNNQMIDEIVYEGQNFHFAKQKDLTGTSDIVADNGVDEPIISLGVSGATNQVLLPIEYQQVEYIESTGTQYIDTGVNADYNSRIYVKTTFADYNIIAVQDTSDTNKCIAITGLGRIEHIRFCSGVGTQFLYEADKFGVYEIELSNSKAIAYYSGKTATFDITDSVDVSIDLNFFIFARNKDGVASDFSKRKLYALKLWNGDTLVRNYIPCYRKVDNVIGMYDLVNGVFYTNKGTGTFVKGADYNQTPTPEAPIPIENANDNGMSVILRGENLFNAQGDVERNDAYGLGNIRFENNYIENASVKPSAANYLIYSKVYKAGTYTVSAKGEYASNSFTFRFLCTAKCNGGTYNSYYKSYYFDLLKDTLPQNTFTFTTTEDFQIGFAWAASPSNLRGIIYDIMLTPTSQAVEYKPYVEETIAIPTSIVVNGTNVPLLFSKYDKLTVDRLNNKAVYSQGSYKRTYTGNESLYASIFSENNGYGRWYCDSANLPITSTALCTHFKRTSWIPDLSVKNVFVPAEVNSTTKRIFFKTDGSMNDTFANDMAKFKEWLKSEYDAGTPVTVIAKRITPIEYDITNTDLGQSLLALATHKGTNYLEISSNLAPSQTDLSYWRQIIPNE